MNAASAAEASPGSPLLRRVSGRAVVLGFVCSAALCAVTPYNDFKVAATYISGNQFPIGAIFVLMLLSGAVNPLLRKLKQARHVWSQTEMLAVWAIILIAAGLPSSGMMRFFIPQIVAVHYFSDNVISAVWLVFWACLSRGRGSASVCTRWVFLPHQATPHRFCGFRS